jgi:hypothetical protein
MTRPFLDRGVPPHFRQYDLGFLHWLARSGREVDMLAQQDVEGVSGARLARLYDLIVFPGHHEYVTRHEFDAIERYRDLGDGDALGMFGIEVDGRVQASPRNVQVLAVMGNAFGTGRPAEMTYYETGRGARVFAAGAFTLAGRQARRPQMAQVLSNLLEHLLEDGRETAGDR